MEIIHRKCEKMVETFTATWCEQKQTIFHVLKWILKTQKIFDYQICINFHLKIYFFEFLAEIRSHQVLISVFFIKRSFSKKCLFILFSAVLAINLLFSSFVLGWLLKTSTSYFTVDHFYLFLYSKYFTKDQEKRFTRAFTFWFLSQNFKW